MKRFFVTALICAGLLMPLGSPVFAQDAPAAPEVVAVQPVEEAPLSTGNAYLDWLIWVAMEVTGWTLLVVVNLEKIKRFVDPYLEAVPFLQHGSEARAFILTVLVAIAAYATTLTDIDMFAMAPQAVLDTVSSTWQTIISTGVLTAAMFWLHNSVFND